MLLCAPRAGCSEPEAGRLIAARPGCHRRSARMKRQTPGQFRYLLEPPRSRFQAIDKIGRDD
jgi:hypothetical protein